MSLCFLDVAFLVYPFLQAERNGSRKPSLLIHSFVEVRPTVIVALGRVV